VNINYKQPQFELFPGSSAHDDDPTRPRVFLANLTLSVENLVVLTILGIMVAVFAYSLGVERGRHLMAGEMKQAPVTQPAVSATTAAVRPTTVAPAAMTATAHPVGAVGTINAVPAARPAVAVPAAVAQTQPSQALAATFKYTIQVASYADEKFAQKEAGDLNKSGFETLIMQKGKYAILCVGKFAQKNEAMSVISKLKSKYKDCLVRSM
jgi:cell division protein FtsN